MQKTEAERAAAFDRMANEWLDRSYRLATAILRDDDLSKDAVHDAVVLAWQRWCTLRDRSRFDAWFDRIVVNVSRDRLRDRRRRPPSDISAAESISAPWWQHPTAGST